MGNAVGEDVARRLRCYAEQFENADFLKNDPSKFMHEVSGDANREAAAFIAQSVSYGSRSQFLPKVEWILARAGGDCVGWLLSGAFNDDIPDSGAPFYRLYTCGTMNRFLSITREMIEEYGSIGNFVRESATDTIGALDAICRWFAERGGAAPVPKDCASACKRLCMFLRWMVRSGSPVDIGLWADHIDRRTLIMPLDTHVLSEAAALGLMKCRNATMPAARRLTSLMLEVFPDDPLKGDFALFGYGVQRDASLQVEAD